MLRKGKFKYFVAHCGAGLRKEIFITLRFKRNSLMTGVALMPRTASRYYLIVDILMRNGIIYHYPSEEDICEMVNILETSAC